MAFRAKLQFERKEYDVLDCNYSFCRDVDLKGRLSSSVYGKKAIKRPFVLYDFGKNLKTAEKLWAAN